MGSTNNKPNYKKLIFSIALAGTTGLAIAETPADALARCARLPKADARLGCFDAAAKAAAEAIPAPKAEEHPEVIVPTRVVALAPLGAPPPAPDKPLPVKEESPLAKAWDLDREDALGTFVLRGYRPTYFLPVWIQRRPNTQPGTPTQDAIEVFGQSLQNTEAKMQLSFKTKLFNDVLDSPVDLWFGYTQQSHWQLYNRDQSAPFRETNYEPELMATLPVHAKVLGMDVRLLGGGIVHQSNGQSDPLSRSWNRVYGMVGAERGNLTLTGRLWAKLPERRDSSDNPDIMDYMGYGDLLVDYKLDKNNTVGSLLRYNPSTGKGAVRLDWTFPVAGRLRGYMQYFYGYGESLIDYNYKNHGIGIGLMLNDWMSP
ncbi:phospholipase A [Gulbenkiania mobilis]|uniref:phospholipase A n=1 Tax=Gulbenkiania mobilis TaxID=397457 RepID=UPI0009F9BD67|nr:phospholipase A [Gulbenkiania mobilis]